MLFWSYWLLLEQPLRQAETQKELAVLMPSVLAKAFAGEL